MNLDLFINMVINSSVIASLLTALIFIFKLVFGRHISARWHYVIWFVLLLRLSVPYMIPSHFFISDLFKTASTFDGFADGIKYQTIISTPVFQSSSLLESIGQAFKTYISFILSNAETLFVIWALGVVILSLYYFVYNSLFWRRVKNGTVFTDQNIINLLEDCKHKLNVQTNISLIQTSGISIPAIFGVTRPWLLMPERVLKIMEYENLRYIILHELAHLKRKDIVINWISLILQIIHWFNPFVWFAFSRMRIDRELACDESVLLNLEQNEVKQYGHTILDLVEIISGRVRYAGVAGILEAKSQIRDRILRISRFKGGENKFIVLVVMMLVLFGSSILVNADNINSGGKSDSMKAGVSTGASMNIGDSTDSNIPITTNTNNKVVSDKSAGEAGDDSDAVQNKRTDQQKNAVPQQSTAVTQQNTDIKQQGTAGTVQNTDIMQQGTDTLIDETFDENGATTNDPTSSSATDQISTDNTDDTSDEGVINISPTAH